MRKLMMAALFALPMFDATAMAQDTLKIGYIDPLSGGGAGVGERGLKTFQFLADELNAKGGVLGKKVEIVPFDNKLNPQESLHKSECRRAEILAHADSRLPVEVKNRPRKKEEETSKEPSR